MPPRLPLNLLKWFCKPEYHIDVEGDLLEMYNQRVDSMGRRRAVLLLWRDVILLFRPGMIQNLIPSYQSNMIAVAQHNVTISFRNFWRDKTSFFISLGSLAAGLVCALFIYLWISDELSKDKFLENNDRLYRVLVNYASPAGITTEETTPTPLAEALVSDFPEVEYVVSVNQFVDWFKGPGILAYENKQVKAQGLFGGRDFFKVFSYQLLHGNSTTALSQKNNVVISKDLALRLFNDVEGAVGKTIEWTHIMRLNGPFVVAGVFDDVSKNSTFQFDIIFNYEKLSEGDIYSTEWNSSYSETIVLVREDANVAAFNQKLVGYLLSKEPTNPGELFLSRYSDRYLYGNYENGIQSGGRISYVKLFALVAIFTLVIACINFVNLSTARASKKMKEVGVKKALGVSRTTLVWQFLVESVLLAFLSLGIAILVVFVLLPNFNLLTGKHLSLDLNPWIFVFTFVAGILSGCYPAFFLSGFKTTSILKGKLLGSSFGERLTRKGLVIMQFTISIVFIIAFMIVNKQIEFVQGRNLGYVKDQVISFDRRGSLAPNDYETFISELKNVPGVVNASSMFGGILNRSHGLHSGFKWEGQVGNLDAVSFPSPWISHDLIETLGIELKEGRTFRRDLAATEKSKLIVNEAAVKMMGFKDPIGKIVDYGPQELEIVGVVKDFHYGSLHTPLAPVFFMYAFARRDIVVKVEAASEKQTLEQLQGVYQKFHPGYAFEFTYLDEDYKSLYDSETRVSSLSTYFAILATLISCMGLFGLAVFSSERRTKEIGIRKVLGATASGIVRLLATDIIRPVFVAILIAIPSSYFIATSWLDEFAYRIDLSWWFFAGAGLLALVVTCVTVGLQTLKAAKANPVSSLKSE